MAASKLTSPVNSMVYSFFLFLIVFSAQQVYAEKLASSEAFTILGGFISSLLFLFALTFLGNLQEYLDLRTGWGAVAVALLVAVSAASFIHGVSCTTCVLFSTVILYEISKVSVVAHQQVTEVVKKKKAA
eukprot:TRINITY_DN661_c0_g4_i2.p2 TRINITY_DN661_c0_g4~~TRINITY_DN661_c0_g4_i2.p2  ORF type:complete len:130 (+),score=32.75 TRINITY_DN661_c0_g4_i2:196-585(+)